MRCIRNLISHVLCSKYLHGSHRPGKVMEFNPWLEKSLNFMFTWKNGILPGKVIENQWKSLKNFMCHAKLNLNMKTLMIIWLKVSLCHNIWDQIGETMLADLHSTASCYIVADSGTTCYIVAAQPSSICRESINDQSSLPLTVSDEVLVVQKTTSYRENDKMNIRQIFLQSTVQICMLDYDAFNGQRKFIVLHWHFGMLCSEN